MRAGRNERSHPPIQPSVGGAAILVAPGVAGASEDPIEVVVCNAYVGDRCTEIAHCLIDSRGNYMCSDGSMGGPDISRQQPVIR